MNGYSFDRQITATVIAVAESNSDVSFSRARAPNFTRTSRVPLDLDSRFVDVNVLVPVPSNVVEYSAPLCCSIPMGSTSRYSSYNCLTSWDSYDRIPRYQSSSYLRLFLYESLKKKNCVLTYLCRSARCTGVKNSPQNRPQLLTQINFKVSSRIYVYEWRTCCFVPEILNT